MPERSESDAVVEWMDAHCHVQGGFGGEVDEGAVLARASEAGVSHLVCVGTDAGTSEAALDLARRAAAPGSAARAEHVALSATVGLHPHTASEGVDSLAGVIGALGPDDPVVAIGECGLDYHYEHSPRADQREAFAAQVALAKAHDLALVVHTRDAWDDTFDVLDTEGAPERTVIHCFTGGPDEARRCIERGYVLSFSGIVTFANAAEVREAAALAPADAILVETDAPYLAPVPHRGRPNEPAYVPLVGAALAAARAVDIREIARLTTENARRVFRLPV